MIPTLILSQRPELLNKQLKLELIRKKQKRKQKRKKQILPLLHQKQKKNKLQLVKLAIIQM